jgi:DNA-binding response OmpR family regulator
MRLLIVEDERLLRRSLTHYFELRGYEVAEAGCLAEAEEQLATGPFEAALVDVCLPDGNGLCLLERIGSARVIAMSAHPSFFELGGRAVLHRMEKPLDLAHAERLVARLAAA